MFYLNFENFVSEFKLDYYLLRKLIFNYNEYIFYESALFHCAYWKKENWTTKYPRFTFNTFTW